MALRLLAPISVLVVGIPYGCASTTPSAQSVAAWAEMNREAAHQLANWGRSHIKAMRHFLRWESEQPEAFRDFVLWTLRNPTQGFGLYASSHAGGAVVGEIAAHHALSAQTFMDWCRRFPGPAEDLVQYHRPLDWVGDHLYRL